MEHWESSIKKEQERIQIKIKVLYSFKYIFVNFLDGGMGDKIKKRFIFFYDTPTTR